MARRGPFPVTHMAHRYSLRRPQGSLSPGRILSSDQPRRAQWAGKSPQQVLAHYQIGKTPPLKVLEVMLQLFNTLHTSLEKSVSHKTREERAQFLRRFFRDLQLKAGFKTLPDPRNLGQKHIHAMVQVWQRQKLAPATIQTYLSFLRGLAMWLGKPGFIRSPEHYGMSVELYQRHESAQRDKSWCAAGIDTDALIAQVCTYDQRVGASLRLIQTMGLRRKESVQFRPFTHVVPFEATGLSPDEKQADRYVKTKGKGGRVRFVALDSPARIAAVEFALGIVRHQDDHVSDPTKDLKQNLRRFDYVMEKFGITIRERGATGHGLRHEVMNDTFEAITGEPSPVRGGRPLPPEIDRAARISVSQLAGHARTRAASAYIGGRVGKPELQNTPQMPEPPSDVSGNSADPRATSEPPQYD